MHRPLYLQLEEALTLMCLVLGILQHRPPKARLLDEVCPASEIELRPVRLGLGKGLQGVAPVPQQILLLG